MIESNLVTFLNAQAAITALVSSRIYGEILPPNPTYPCVSYRTESHDLPNNFSGNTGFCRSDYLIDAWSDDLSAAITLSNALRTALKNHTGSFGGINVMQIHITAGPETVYEESIDAYRITQIFSIWHNEG